MDAESRNNFMILSNGHIVDNAVPWNPVLTAQYSFNGDGVTVLLDGDEAYFGTGMTNDLFIASIANITFPLQLSSIDFNIGNGVFGMDIYENTLFATLGMDGIVVSIDITNKSFPQILDTLIIDGGQCRDIVAISNNYAYAAHYGGLKLIDISDPSNMSVLSSIGSGYNSIESGNNMLFLGKSSGGVDVFSVEDPVNPLPLFSIPNTAGTVWDLKYKESNLYLATNSGGLFIYRVFENEAVEMVNFSNTGNGQTFGVGFQDTLVLLPGLINGIATLYYDSTGFVDIQNNINELSIEIYPNPAGDYLYVESGMFINPNIFIKDIVGNTVLSFDSYRPGNKIDISNLKTGQYNLIVRLKEQSIIKKFVKVK